MGHRFALLACLRKDGTCGKAASESAIKSHPGTCMSGWYPRRCQTTPEAYQCTRKNIPLQTQQSTASQWLPTLTRKSL